MGSSKARMRTVFSGVAMVMLSAGFAPAMAAPSCMIEMMANLPVEMDGMRVNMPATINGHHTDLMLDSGAFFSIMSKAKATEFGLKLDSLPPDLHIGGIGGEFSADLGTAETFTILGTTFKQAKFIVGGSDTGRPIIGRNVIGIADTDFDIAHGSVKLMKPHDCGKANMAYWAAGNPHFEAEFNPGDDSRNHLFEMPVSINGVKIRAELDTGADVSIITRHAAERAKIDLNAPGVQPVDRLGGFGRSFVRGWIVPVDRVDIGNEGILKPNIMVIDGDIAPTPDAPEMLLGMDYLLSHHMYFARDQRRIYFTYSGGAVFQARTGGAGKDAGQKTASTSLPEGAQRAKAVDDSAAPTTATQFAARGKVRQSQRNPAGAIADFSKAVELDPRNPDRYGDRANAYMQSGQLDLARADLDKALGLKPDSAELLRDRAMLRFSQKDKAGALADADAAARLIPPTSLESLVIAEMFEELGQPSRAIPIYTAAIAVHREDAQLSSMLNGRCWARALANVELDEALKDCDRAVRLEKANAAYIDSRALVYFRKGDFAHAIADYDQALALQPKEAWSMYMRGLAKIRLGQDEAGKADEAAARGIRPDVVEVAVQRGIVK